MKARATTTFHLANSVMRTRSCSEDSRVHSELGSGPAGATWTTDAPFRETAETIAAMKSETPPRRGDGGRRLYAFASARKKPVICFAHVTNQMARIEGDFQKGEADGAVDALAVITEAARACLP